MIFVDQVMTRVLAAAAVADPEACARAKLKSFLAAAGVLSQTPDTDYETIAHQFIEQDVADEISLRDSPVGCSAPAFDLKSAVLKPAQAYTIMEYLDEMN